MLMNEEVRQQHRQIKCTPGKLDGGGAELVTTTRPDGKIQVAQDKQELEKVTKENESKYILAHDSPPLNAPLVDILKPSGPSQATTEIAEGTFHPPTNVDATSKKWFEQMEKTNQAKMHLLSHCKFPQRNARMVEKKQRQSTRTRLPSAQMHNDIPTVFETAMLNVPHQSGYSPKC